MQVSGMFQHIPCSKSRIVSCMDIVVHNVHEPCMFHDSVLEHARFTGTGQAWYRSETCMYFYLGLHACTMHNSMHGTGIFHA